MELSYSKLQCFADCPKRYENKYVKKLRKIAYEEEDVAKTFGKCIHKALELRDKVGLQAGIDWFKENYKELLGELLKTVDNGVRLLTEYDRWEKKNFCGIEILSTEVKDTFTVKDIIFTVVLDRVVKLNGNIYVLDYKTTTSRSVYFFKRFELNTQVDAYCAYVKGKYGQCSGFIPIQMYMQWVVKPKLFALDMKDEASEYSINEIKYSKYYKADMIYASGFHNEFDYEIVNRNVAQLEDFKIEIQKWCSKIETEQSFPKNKGNCTQYGGCEYKDLCKSLDDETIVRNLYETMSA